jgi:DNA-directed RNA polymerase specialized sigma24 family protein
LALLRSGAFQASTANSHSLAFMEMEVASKPSLDQGFKEFWKKNSPTGRSLFVSVRCNLHQFRLVGLYTEACVLSEVYLRALKFIEKGGTITNLLAWSRSTAYNYTRELRREGYKTQLTDQIELLAEHEQIQTKQSALTDEAVDEELAIIRQAFAQLSVADQRLLYLSTIAGLQWKTIHSQCVSEEGKQRSEAALRKAKERAIKRLRENYHSIKSARDSKGTSAA